MSGAVTVEQLWRYPVKSMQGERLDVADVDEWGIRGDRQWAVFDLTTGLALTAKREPQLLMSSARAVMAGADIELAITLPDGTDVHGLAESSRELTAVLGRPVEVRRADPEHAATYEIAADFEAEHDSELFQWAGPAGTFHDSTKTRLSIAALEEMRDWAPRRFRINVLVSGASSRQFVGHDVVLGEVEVEVVKHIDRCVLVTRPQPGGIERDLDVLRTINAEMGGMLGAGSMILRGGRIAVGDRVEVAVPRLTACCGPGRALVRHSRVALRGRSRCCAARAAAPLALLRRSRVALADPTARRTLRPREARLQATTGMPARLRR